MPDIYAKGEPHKPTTTITGHFVGMHPAGPLVRPTTAWYRGDDLADVIDQGKRAIDRLTVAHKTEVDSLLDRIADLEAQLTVATQRRAPKRAGERTGG